MVTLRNVVLIWLTAVFCLWGSVTLASSLFDNTASNVWMLDKTSGRIVSTFSVSSSDGVVEWIEQAVALSPSSARITYDTGSQDIGDLDLLSQEVLVNQTQNSLPPLDTSLPPTTLAGIDLALSDPNPKIPGISINPAAGTYDKTIGVHLHGITARTSLSPLSIYWRINGGALQNRTATAAGEDIKHSFYFVANGDYTVEFWAMQNGYSSQPNPQTATFKLNTTEPLQRDSDGDQIPDVVEADLGLDPLSNDYARDSDNDGWNDFIELFLGSDPNNPLSLPAFSPIDSDGDGCSDYVEILLGNDPFDLINVPASCNAGLITLDSDSDGVPDKFEELRGTDKLDATVYPVARRPFEVEYLVNGSIFQNAGETTTKQMSMGEFTVRDINWETLFDQTSLTGIAKTEADSALNGGDLPPNLRLPAGDQLILRARHLAGVTDKWVVKSWMDSTADIQPRDAAQWHEGQGNPLWTTADQWMAALEAYLAEFLVQNKSIAMSPATGLGVALIEGVVAWYAALSDGALILLGHDANPTPEDAVSVLRIQLSQADRNLNSLHSELLSLTGPGKELADFAGAVSGFYSDPGSIVQSTTTREAAAMVQGGNRDTQVSYVARLLAIMPLASIDALDLSPRIVLMDPSEDTDGDGVANGSELNKNVEQATLPDKSDSDGDGLADGFDPCPADSDNLCLWKQHQEDDTDGDTIVDAVDNCMNTSNSDQQDSNSDGIGDVCAFYANIQKPASDATIWSGDEVEFTSLVTEHGSGLTLNYSWTFSGGAANSNLENPGKITFNSPGDYLVKLVVEDTATHASLGEDYRTVHVIGIPSYTVSTSAPAAEGSFTPTIRTVDYNQTTTFIINAKSGYIIDTATGCGGLWTGSNPYMTGPITADCTVEASFTALPLGDVNGDSIVSLADSIIILQLQTGMDPGIQFTERYLPATDNRWGMEEIIFIIQEIASQ